MRRAGRRESARVGLYGRLGSGNYGNDGSMEAILGFLRERHPEWTVDCMCSGPDVIRERFGIPATDMHWDTGGHTPSGSGRADVVRTGVRVLVGITVDGWRTARWVRNHSAVVVPGMGTFETTLPVRPWQIPWGLFILATSGRWFGVRVAFVGVGASPVQARLTRALLAGALRQASYRSFRDEYSRSSAAWMGVDTTADDVYPDLALALRPAEVPDMPSSAVGIGVMAWYGASRDPAAAATQQARYEDVIAEFACWLVDSGHPIRLFAGDDADAEVALRLRSRLLERRPGLSPSTVVFVPVSGLAELTTQMSDLLVVVGSRYHNVVSALMCGRPTIAVGYSAKHHVLMERFGLPEHAHDIATVTASDLKASFEVLSAHVADVSAAVRAVALRESAAVEGQFAALAAALEGPDERRSSRWG